MTTSRRLTCPGTISRRPSTLLGTGSGKRTMRSTWSRVREKARWRSSQASKTGSTRMVQTQTTLLMTKWGSISRPHINSISIARRSTNDVIRSSRQHRRPSMGMRKRQKTLRRPNLGSVKTSVNRYLTGSKRLKNGLKSNSKHSLPWSCMKTPFLSLRRSLPSYRALRSCLGKLVVRRSLGLQSLPRMRQYKSLIVLRASLIQLRATTRKPKISRKKSQKRKHHKTQTTSPQKKTFEPNLTNF